MSDEDLRSRIKDVLYSKAGDGMSKTNYAVPTGSYLDEWLEENHMTRTELAGRLGASRKHVSQLVSGKVPLSYELAEDLALVTGVSARIWNNYEALYRADLARLQKETRIDMESCITDWKDEQ